MTSDVEAINRHFVLLMFPLIPVINLRTLLHLGKCLVLKIIHICLFTRLKGSSCSAKSLKLLLVKTIISLYVFDKCSFELANTFAHIFNCSLSSGCVHVQWLSAVITPVPKHYNPVSVINFRPISVTPILSRMIEKIVVSQRLCPAINPCCIADQFGFRPTGGTTALLFILCIM